MGWPEVVSLLLNLILGSAVWVQWVTIKSVKSEAASNAKKAEANAQASEIQNVEAVITLWREMAEKMAADRASLAEQVEDLSSEVRRLKNATNRMARLLDKITVENFAETIETIKKEIGDEYTTVSNSIGNLANRVQNTTADS